MSRYRKAGAALAVLSAFLFSGAVQPAEAHDRCDRSRVRQGKSSKAWKRYRKQQRREARRWRKFNRRWQNAGFFNNGRRLGRANLNRQGWLGQPSSWRGYNHPAWGANHPVYGAQNNPAGIASNLLYNLF